MSAAREKIDGVLRHLQQREEKQRQAAAAWERARSRCFLLAQTLLEGTQAAVQLEKNRLLLLTNHGSFGEFVFDPKQLALVGLRKKEGEEAAPFFSLRIEPPPRLPGHVEGQWGPGPVEGISALTKQVGSQEAFEKAIADWFEWAFLGAGAPLAGA